MSQSKKSDRWALLREPGVQVYLVIALAALGVLVFVQMSQRYSLLGQFLTLVFFVTGLLGILFRFRVAPVLLLVLFDLDELFLVAREFINHPQYVLSSNLDFGYGFGTFQPLRADTLMLCVGFLAYCAAQYRLQSLAYAIFPPDPRQVEDLDTRAAHPAPRRPVRLKRSPGLVGADEMILLLAGLPFCALLAQFCWIVLRQPAINIFRLPFPLSRVLFVGWVLVVGVAMVSAVLSYWRWAQLSPEQATLLLQDDLWRETRGEQRRLNRRLAGWWLRRKNK
jgi:hypothetical protein